MNYKLLVKDAAAAYESDQSLIREGKGEKATALSGWKKAMGESLSSGHFSEGAISFRKLFKHCFGDEETDHYCARDGYTFRQVMEAAGPIMTAAFQNISQQFTAATYLKAYSVPTSVFTPLIPTVPTDRRFERIVGVGHVGDEFDGIVAEGKEYPEVTVSEDWVDTPEVLKRGRKASVTKETVKFDETGLVLDRCKFLGKWLGVNREKRAVDCIIDGNTTAHRYIWQGTTYGSYQSSTPWVNVKTSTSLTDYKSIDAARQVLLAITDPQTGEPQDIDVRHLVVAPELQMQARVALAPEVSVATPGYATSSNPVRGTIPNPVLGAIGGAPQIVSSQYVYTRLTAASVATTSWFIGNITEYAEYREAFPDTFEQFGVMGQLQFDRDIIIQFKASGMGAYRVKQPRAMLKATA